VAVFVPQQPSTQDSPLDPNISFATATRMKQLAPHVLGGARLSWSVSQTRERTARAPLDAYRWLATGFEANVGQFDSRVDFLSRGYGYTLFLTASGLRLDLANRGENHSVHSVPLGRGTLAIRFVDANRNPSVHTLAELRGRTNYFHGKEPSAWRTGIPHYSRVEYHNVFPGINVAYHSRSGELEYDFHVAAGADPGAIALDLQGPERIWLNSAGALVLNFPGGQVVQPPPVIYQGEGEDRREVPGGFVLEGRNRLRFQLGPYNKRQPLTIDPVLVYSTYLGDSGDDIGCGIALDQAGNIYLTGWTDSTGFPTAGSGGTESGFSTVLAGATDAFVVKLNASGTELLYSTFIGGADEEFEIVGLAIDAAGSAYITGSSKSKDYPTTPGAFQTTHGGGTVDAVVTKLSPSGSALEYSTFLGGTGLEGGQIIALDDSGNAYLTGFTGSQNFPVTPGAFQQTYAGGAEAFVTKLAADGGSLVYSTYLGGQADEMPTAGLALDALGSAYVMGTTNSPNFPVTPGAFQTVLNGPSDAFVVKLTPSGRALEYSTFLGGSGPEEGRSVIVGSGGEAYVAGLTVSPDFPTTPGAFQAVQRGAGDVFVAKLSPLGTSLSYSSYLGGTGLDITRGFGLDAAGSFYISGATRSSDFPITPDAVQTVHAGGEDVFVTKINASGEIAYSTYLGGTGNDRARNMAVDELGDVFVVGFTSSPDFPLVNPFQGEFRGGVRDCFFAGGCDTFVAKIEGLEPLRIQLTSTISSLSGGEALPFTMAVSNVANEPRSADLSLALRLPNGQQFEVLHLASLTLPPDAVATVQATLGPLPESIPLGAWQLIGAWAEPRPTGPVIRFVDILDFNVIGE
jgi:hypothetical protein